MPRLHLNRTVGTERSLARRIEALRRDRDLGVEALAKLMTEAGCAINGSAIYRIEKGDPPRRISVDELIAFSKVFELEVEDLLTPIELVHQERARAIALEIRPRLDELSDNVYGLFRLFLEWTHLTSQDPELTEFIVNHIHAAHPDNVVLDPTAEDLGWGVDQASVDRVNRLLVDLINTMSGAAAKARKVES